MSTDTPNHGFFVRIGLHGHLCREHAADPVAAVRSLLHKGSSLHDKDRAWVWRASPLRPDLYDAARPARAGAFGPVGDPIVFEVGLELLELEAPSADPEVMLEQMVEESEKTAAPPYPTAPGIASCRYHSDQDVFFVNFKGNLPEVFPGARVKRRDGVAVAPGLVRGCEVDQFRRNVLVELADGAQTSFSAIDVLYEVNPEFSAQWDAAAKGRGRVRGDIVHVLNGGAPLCGFMPGSVPGEWPGGHKWVGIKMLDDATCPACRTRVPVAHELSCPSCGAHGPWVSNRCVGCGAPVPEVTDSAQPDTSKEDGKARERRIRAEVTHATWQLDPLVTARAIWEAVDDLDAILPGTSPADVVEKHLRNGNIRKDGR